MKIKFPLLLFCSALLFFDFTPLQQKETLLPFISNYHLFLRQTDWSHTEKYDYSAYAAGSDILQLKDYHNITRAKAQKTLEDRKFFISSMFKDQISPYPGVLSSVIGCPEDQRPKAIEDTAEVRLYYYLPATSNLIYGNCNLSDNAYYCLYALFFCPEKSELYELKIFTPILHPSFEYKNLIASIYCK
jgi:hypothetical protein